MRIFAVFAILAMFSIANASHAIADQWTNTLKPQGEAGQAIGLANRGTTRYRLVLPSDPTSVDIKAAVDLARWLREMTGAEFPILRENAEGLSQPFISIGHTKMLSDAGLTHGPSDLGRDGYLIAQRGENLFLSGGSRRGSINAVYALLEEDLGCRWFDVKAPAIPRAETLAFRPVSRSYVPPFDIRDPYYYEAFNPDWSLCNRTNGVQSGIPVEYGGFPWAPKGWFTHSFSYVMTGGEHFKEHPEYYALIEGKRSTRQLCLTNRDVVKLTTGKALEALRKDPGASLISISDYDGGGHCQCPDCKALDDANGSPSGSLITFVNQVAEAIEAEFPRVTVTTLAYLDRIDPPTQVRPRKNVAIQLCNDLHSWRWPLTDFVSSDRPLSKQYRDAIVGWSKICDQIQIWDYTVNFEHYLGPMPNMHVLAPSVEFYQKHKVTGVMFQGSYQGLGGERAAMRAWVMAKLLWNPQRNVQDLQRDFVFGHYGESAGPIWEYYQLLESEGRKHQDQVGEALGGCRFPMNAPFITPEFIRRADDLFAQALALAKTDQMRNRVQLEQLPIIYVKINRAKELAGDKIYTLIDEFEKIAQRNSIDFTKEGSPDVKSKIAYWRSLASIDLSKLGVHGVGNVWKVNIDPANVGETEKWFAPEFDDSKWLDVRSDTETGWESQGFPHHIGYGWYRQRIVVTDEMLKSKFLWMLFGAVDEGAEVYVDGAKVFTHTSESTGLHPHTLFVTPFKFDAKSRLTAGEHVVAVRVYNGIGAGGVYKPVYLIASDVDLDAKALFDTITAQAAERKAGQ